MKQNIGNFANATRRAKIARRDLQSCTGPLFLGIDAGSTTTKAALIDQNEKLVFSFYRNNEGNPLEATKQLLTELYEQLPAACYIANTTVTGYGEGLIKAALQCGLRDYRDDGALQGGGGIPARC